MAISAKSSVLQASMVNAYNSHILEMDDVHKESIVHPAAPVISTAFSLAEHLCSSGRELIEAIVAEYDVMIRIGEAVAPSHYLIWHSTGTCGNFEPLRRPQNFSTWMRSKLRCSW